MKIRHIPDPTTPRLWRKVLVHSDRDGRAVVQVLKGMEPRGKPFTVLSGLLRDEPIRRRYWGHLREQEDQ